MSTEAVRAPRADVTPPVTREDRRRASRRRHRDDKVAFLLVAPAVVMLGVFVLWPAAYAGFLSFHEWSFYRDPLFVGVKNYVDVLTDPLFIATIWRSFRFVLLTVPVMLTLAFAFSSLVVTVSRRFATVLKVSIYIPTIISTVIASIIFVLIYDYSGGLLNWVLGAFGVDPVAWIGDPKWALLAVAVPAIWLGMGLTSLIMVAAMLDIPAEYYEAAAMEGANWWQRTRYITLPQMKNVGLYLTVTGFVAAVQQYELPLVMTSGGPLDSTTLPNLFIFNHFRNDINMGYSVAAALVLFVVLGSVSALVFRFVNSERLVD